MLFISSDPLSHLGSRKCILLNHSYYQFYYTMLRCGFLVQLRQKSTRFYTFLEVGTGRTFFISHIVKDRILSFAQSLSVDNAHFLSNCFSKNRRLFQSFKCRNNRFLNSFIPTAIRFLNESSGR